MKNLSLGFKTTTKKTLSKIRKTVDQKNYKLLQLQCYVCENKDHIAIDCPEFSTIEGNIRNYFEKRRNESHISEEGSTKGKNARKDKTIDPSIPGKTFAATPGKDLKNFESDRVNLQK